MHTPYGAANQNPTSQYQRLGTGAATDPNALTSLPTVSVALATAAKMQASDVHIAEGMPPWVRHGGAFGPLAGLNAVSAAEVNAVMHQWGSGPDTSETVIVEDRRWRLTCFKAANGLRASFRRVPSFPPELQKLGLPEEVETLISHSDGLIITAGATGAGKTTTLASLVNEINMTQSVHILTVEDPIEYRYAGGRSLISQRNVPVEEQRIALKTALRADPDVVFLGECRLPEHFDLCLTLAATGHLVLTSVHARDAASACQRVASATGNSGRSSLAQTLRAVISQRLIPDMHDHTKRHVAAEVMINRPAIQQFIRPDGEIGAIQRLLRDEHKGMDRVLLDMVIKGQISVDSARNEALDIDHLNNLLERLL